MTTPKKKKSPLEQSLGQIAEMIKNAADWAGSPHLQPTLAKLCATLDPYCEPQHARPDVPLFLGLLMGRLGTVFMDQAPSLDSVYYSYFDRAAFYYEKASAIKMHPNNLDAAIARNALGHLYETGLITPDRKPNREKAFQYHLLAAQEGLAEAQLYTAVNYAEGFGTPPSLSEAVFWTNAATDNQNQLSAEQQVDLFEAKAAFESAFVNAHPSEDPHARMAALQRARMETDIFPTTKPQ